MTKQTITVPNPNIKLTFVGRDEFGGDMYASNFWGVFVAMKPVDRNTGLPFFGD